MKISLWIRLLRKVDLEKSIKMGPKEVLGIMFIVIIQRVIKEIITVIKRLKKKSIKNISSKRLR
jgi:hypothetical protein